MNWEESESDGLICMEGWRLRGSKEEMKRSQTGRRRMERRRTRRTADNGEEEEMCDTDVFMNNPRNSGLNF